MRWLSRSVCTPPRSGDCCDPIGVETRLRSFPGYRFAQPPANGYDPYRVAFRTPPRAAGAALLERDQRTDAAGLSQNGRLVGLVGSLGVSGAKLLQLHFPR